MTAFDKDINSSRHDGYGEAGVEVALTAFDKDINSSRHNAYGKAGVDVVQAESIVQQVIAPMALKTIQKNARATVAMGGFAAAFDLKNCGYRDPILLAATDGVGTKLLLAEDSPDKHFALCSIGQDLVAMCVNDIAACGGSPLFFLDYISCERLNEETIRFLMEGITNACQEVGASLIGGETAEMPHFYPKGTERFDVAGFALGAIERKNMFKKETIHAGDMLVALPSSGCHANGFSLIRAILKKHNCAIDAPSPFDKSRSLRDVLLTPTALYSSMVGDAVERQLVKGLAHITGGGLFGNLPRCLPENVTPRYDLTQIPPQDVFLWLKELGGMDDQSLFSTFNGGIGMVAVTDQADALLELWKTERAFVLGRIE